MPSSCEKKRIPASAKVAILLVFLAGLSFAGAAYLHWLAGAPRRALDKLAETLQAHTHEEVRYFLMVNRISPRADLVLAEVETNVAGEYANNKELFGVDFGTTSLSFTVPVRYHYAVDVAGEDPVAFRLDAATGTLFLSVHPLRVLSAEADFGRLEKSTTVGWARLAKYSGRDVEKQFRERVTADVREKGNRNPMRAEAENAARKQLEILVRRYVAKAHPAAANSIRSVLITFDLPSAVGDAVLR